MQVQDLLSKEYKTRKKTLSVVATASWGLGIRTGKEGTWSSNFGDLSPY
jgi:hypothetical protein